MHSNGRPETVYELCEMVCEAIAERPLNYVQQRWHTDAKAWNKEACGTAYCRAGWMASFLRKGSGPCTDDGYIHRTATAALVDAGADPRETARLFDGGAISFSTVGPTPAIGTPAYVEAGIKGMRRFMDRYEQKLKHARINNDNSITLLEGHPDYADTHTPETQTP